MLKQETVTKMDPAIKQKVDQMMKTQKVSELVQQVVTGASDLNFCETRLKHQNKKEQLKDAELTSTLDLITDQKVQAEWDLNDYKDELLESRCDKLRKTNQALLSIEEALKNKNKAPYILGQANQGSGPTLGKMGGMNEADTNAALFKCREVNNHRLDLLIEKVHDSDIPRDSIDQKLIEIECDAPEEMTPEAKI